MSNKILNAWSFRLDGEEYYVQETAVEYRFRQWQNDKWVEVPPDMVQKVSAYFFAELDKGDDEDTAVTEV
ncbi:MAG: hypothetical protein HF973_12455 [Chloroflexi bacterium]|nr:hypothetical protein [Chloroflexota bacterium]